MVAASDAETKAVSDRPTCWATLCCGQSIRINHNTGRVAASCAVDEGVYDLNFDMHEFSE